MKILLIMICSAMGLLSACGQGPSKTNTVVIVTTNNTVTTTDTTTVTDVSTYTVTDTVVDIEIPLIHDDQPDLNDDEDCCCECDDED